MKNAMAWCLAGSFMCLAAGVTAAQQTARPGPTAADWASLAKLPDFTGVWELSFGGPPPRGAAPAAPVGRGGPAGPGEQRGGANAAARGRGRGFAAGPSLTPEYAAKTN